MALITHYSAANRVIDTALTVTYTRNRISGSWGWSNGLNGGGTFTAMQEYHRRARKAYRYVGMTDAAKEECVAAMIALYTVDVYTSYWESSGAWQTYNAGKDLIADISPQHNDDGSWDVIVNVSEDNVRYMLPNEINNIIWNLFNYERRHDYDGESETA